MPTGTSSDPRLQRTAGPAGTSGRRRISAGVGALAVGLGLFWLGQLFVRYRSGSWVDGDWVFDDSAWAFDLSAYVNAAQRLIDEGSLYAAGLVAGSFVPGPADLFYYAPPLGVAMLPFTDVPLVDSSTIWWALRIGALLLACGLMPVRPLLRSLAFAAVAFSLPALQDSIIGNVSLLLVLPMVLAWRWMDRPLGSVAMAMAISVRPSLGLFLVWQLLRRRWRAAAWTAGAGVALVVLTLPFVGVGGYRDYIAVLGNIEIPGAGSENRDLGTLVASLGAGPAAAGPARLLGMLLAIVAVAFSLRRDRECSYMVMLSASLLMVPLLWGHYLATLVVPAAFLAQRLWAPLIVLPLLAWFPVAAPLLVIATMLLPLLVGRASSATDRSPPLVQAA